MKADKNYPHDLEERLFGFVVSTIRFLRTLDNSPEVSVIRYQLIKSSTSAGANYEEAQAGSSRKDFGNKSNISLKEMRESNYWLRLMAALEIGEHQKLHPLVQESKELKLILGAIVKKINKPEN